MKKTVSILLAAAVTASALTAFAREADYQEVLEKGIFKDSQTYVENIGFEDAELGKSFVSGDSVNDYTSVNTLAEDSSLTITDGGEEHGHVLDIKNGSATSSRNMIKLIKPDISSKLGKTPGLYVMSADFLLKDLSDRQLFNIKMIKSDNSTGWCVNWMKNGKIAPPEGSVFTFETDKWYSITYLVDTSNGFTYTYVDNQYIGKDWMSPFKGAYLNEIDFGHSNAADAETLIDNISLSYRAGGSVSIARYNYSDTLSTTTDQGFEDTSKYVAENAAPSGDGLYFDVKQQTLFTVDKDDEKGQFLKASTPTGATNAAPVVIPGSEKYLNGKFSLNMDIKFNDFNAVRKIIGLRTGTSSSNAAWASSGGAWVKTDGTLSQTKDGSGYYKFTSNTWYSIKWVVDTVTGTETLYVNDELIWTLAVSGNAMKGFAKVQATNPAGTTTCYDNIKLRYYEYIAPSESETYSAGDEFNFTSAFDGVNVTNIYLYNNGERVCEMTGDTPAKAVLHEGTNNITAKAFNGKACVASSDPITFNVEMASDRRIVYSSADTPISSLADAAGTDITVNGELKDVKEFTVITALTDSHGKLAGCAVSEVKDGIFTCTIEDVPSDLADGGYTLKVMYWDSMIPVLSCNNL